MSHASCSRTRVLYCRVQNLYDATRNEEESSRLIIASVLRGRREGRGWEEMNGMPDLPGRRYTSIKAQCSVRGLCSTRLGSRHVRVSRHQNRAHHITSHHIYRSSMLNGREAAAAAAFKRHPPLAFLSQRNATQQNSEERTSD